MSTKYDYEPAHREFVESPEEIPVRKLAERHGIASYSALQAQMDRGEWRKEREEFQRALTTKTIDNTASIIAQKRAKITVDALDVIHASIFKMASDMQDHWVTDPENPKSRVFVPGIVITPSELSKLLDRLLTLTGSASVITENRAVDLTPESKLPPDVARLIAEIAGERGSTRGTVGRAALPGAKATRPD